MEILIAMAIMGIIAGVGFSAYTISIEKTRDAQRKSDLDAISKALEAYQSDFGVYPASSSDRVAGCGDGTEVCPWGAPFTLDSGKVYMRVLPRDSRDQYYYSYQTSADRRKYQIFANLENESDPSYDNTLTEICSELAHTCNFGVSSPNATINEVL